MPFESARGGEGKLQVICTKGVGLRKVASSKTAFTKCG